MTKVQFRRWVVRFIECCIIMAILCTGGVGVCMLVSAFFKAIGVA